VAEGREGKTMIMGKLCVVSKKVTRDGWKVGNAFKDGAVLK